MANPSLLAEGAKAPRLDLPGPPLVAGGGARAVGVPAVEDDVGHLERPLQLALLGRLFGLLQAVPDPAREPHQPLGQLLRPEVKYEKLEENLAIDSLSFLRGH